MTIRPSTALLAVALAASAAACATGTSNTYGSGGSTGAIQVRDSITGTPGAVAFTVTVGAVTKAIAKGGVISFSGLAPGDYAVDFGGTMANCSVSNGSAQAATVYAGYVQYLTFITACS